MTEKSYYTSVRHTIDCRKKSTIYMIIHHVRIKNVTENLNNFNDLFFSADQFK